MADVVKESVKIVLSCENISENTIHVLCSRLHQLFGSCVTLEHINTTQGGQSILFKSHYSSFSDALATALQSADVLVTDPNNFSHNASLILSAGSKLQWVHSSYAGVEEFFIAMKSLGLVRIIICIMSKSLLFL